MKIRENYYFGRKTSPRRFKRCGDTLPQHCEMFRRWKHCVVLVCVCVGTRDAREPPSASVGEGGVWMWGGHLGLGQLRVGISQVIPGLPMILVAFYNCVGDAKPPAASLLLPLALINIR